MSLQVIHRELAARKLIDETMQTFWRDQPVITVSEYATQKRILPSDTPFPGPWRNEFTPYLVEIMDNLSAYSGVQHTIVVKGTQLGLTSAAENGLAYWMDVYPAKILFVSATQDVLEVWAHTRLERMLDSCGLRKKIFSQSEAASGKKTGDRTYLKEFYGGFLRLASAHAGPALSAVDSRILFRDEIGRYPRLLATGEGSPLAVSKARTDAWKDRKKIFDFSSPVAFDDLIWPEYESGDQRRFYVPCPYCEQKQILEFGHGFGFEDPNLGLQWSLVDGRVARAWYVCQHCRAELRNHDKRIMLPGGDWRPTSESFSDKVRSYQISSLYSPADMFDWEEMALDYLQAQETGPDGMRSFVNTRLGLPFRETGARPDWTKVYELRGDYRAGNVPDGVIFLTASVDVQRGSEKEDGKKARLEMEVCGHGLGYRTWSIEHRVFEGPIDNPFQGAWEKLSEYWHKTEMAYPKRDGTKFRILQGLVDSGDGPHTNAVYAFTAGWNGVLPSKGMASIKRRKGEPIDEDLNRSIRRFRVAQIEAGTVLVEINGPFYKQQIYTNLKIPRKLDGPQQANFCDFPIEYGESYYKQLTAEEMVYEPDGTVSFRKSSARPNEALDLRVMNLAARDHYLNELVLYLKADAKARGHQPAAIAVINSRTALEWLAQMVNQIPKN